LGTPLKDAMSIADVLTSKYGFATQALYDEKATKKSIYNSLRSLAQKAKFQDSVLIYYTGHSDIDKTSDDGWWMRLPGIP
jgi:hypothetical protein